MSLIDPIKEGIYTQDISVSAIKVLSDKSSLFANNKLRLYGFIAFREQTSSTPAYIQAIESVTINSSMNTITDTCEITIPQAAYKANEFISKYIQVGYIVEVVLGYYPIRYTEFFGYVARIEPGSPMKLICEDESYNYKRIPLDAAIFRNTNYVELISSLYDGPFVSDSIEIGDWQIAGTATLIDVLSELKNKFGAIIYWQNPLTLNYNSILFVDFEQNKKQLQTVLFDVQRNVPAGTDKIKIQTSDDVRPVVYGISVQSDKSKIELYAYYEGDEIIVTETKPRGTLNKFSVPGISRTSLTNLIKRRLPNLFYTGASGEITTFGAPFLQHGMNAAIYDRRLPDRNGVYKIVEVNKVFSAQQGFKQTVKLGQKISDYAPTKR